MDETSHGHPSSDPTLFAPARFNARWIDSTPLTSTASAAKTATKAFAFK
jgi:hypothetical protein